jgi:UDP-sugar transporter A1/2/3
MMIPAVLYLIQNNLQYAAVNLLDPATFQVTYQMKILTTALFSVLMLNKKLNFYKWVSLVILTVGIALVQLPTTVELDIDSEIISFSDAIFSKKIVGLLYVIIGCILSGIAGVWFEKVLKGTEASIWLRNIQLSIFSIIPGLFIGGLKKIVQLIVSLCY